MSCSGSKTNWNGGRGTAGFNCGEKNSVDLSQLLRLSSDSDRRAPQADSHPARENSSDRRTAPFNKLRRPRLATTSGGGSACSLILGKLSARRAVGPSEFRSGAQKFHPAVPHPCERDMFGVDFRAARCLRFGYRALENHPRGVVERHSGAPWRSHAAEIR
jgi:hypothetical protein